MEAILMPYFFGEFFCFIGGKKCKCPAQQCSQ
jgi:hypothetical protein